MTQNYSYKRQTFDHGQYTMLSGQERHEVELVPGDLDLWVEWYSPRDITVWLIFQSGVRVAYSNGLRGSFNVRVRDILSVVLETTKGNSLVVAVQYKELAVTDKLDYTPVVIDPPKGAQLDLSAIMRREVAEQLSRLGYVKEGEPLEIDEEDNLEEDDDDEGFGAGFMEDEVPVELPRRPRAGGKGDKASDPLPGDSDPAVADQPPADGVDPKLAE